MYMCVCAWICHMSAGAHGVQKKVSDFLELELQEVMS